MIARVRLPFFLSLCVGIVAIWLTLARQGWADAPQATSIEAALGWSVVVAIVLCIIHLGAPSLSANTSEGTKRFLGSFGGGLAVGYVFVHLLAELDAGHEIFGDRLHLIVLLGFLVFFVTEYLLARRAARLERGGATHLELVPHIVLGWIYSWLIVYSMPDSVQADGLRVVLPTVAIALHILHGDMELADAHPVAFRRWGRYVLASAPVIGWIGDLYAPADNRAVSVPLVALLAGAVLYKVFRRELPSHEKTHIWGFLAGIVVFVVLDLPLHRA